jgi:hypothetical protein
LAGVTGNCTMHLHTGNVQAWNVCMRGAEAPYLSVEAGSCLFHAKAEQAVGNESVLGCFCMKLPFLGV